MTCLLALCPCPAARLGDGEAHSTASEEVDDNESPGTLTRTNPGEETPRSFTLAHLTDKPTPGLTARREVHGAVEQRAAAEPRPLLLLLPRETGAERWPRCPISAPTSPRSCSGTSAAAGSGSASTPPPRLGLEVSFFLPRRPSRRCSLSSFNWHCAVHVLFPFPRKKSERHCSYHFIFRMLVAPEINLHLFLRRIKRKTVSSDDNISVMFCRCLFECSETTSSSEATTTSISSASGSNKIRSTNERNSKPAETQSEAVTVPA